MFKTIFGKLVAIFVAVLILSISITGISLYLFLDVFVSVEKVKVLEENADKINGFLSIYLRNQDNVLVQSMVQEIIYLYGGNSNSIVWVINKEGGIVLLNERNISSDVIAKLKDEKGRLRLPDERQYGKIISGKYLSLQEKGDFYGLFSDTGVLWLTVEKPFLYNGKVAGAVYLSTPIPEVQKARTSVFKFFVVSVGISLLISIVFIYIFSLRISRRLKQMSSVAKTISKGEFHNRVDIKSEDEIGELADSLNNMAVSLQTLEEMRHEFIANVSHELRTPMTSIRGFIEAILDGVIPQDKQVEYLNIVRDEIMRLTGLVNDLLNLTRLETGEVSLQMNNFDINELIRRCIVKLESLIIRKNISIEAVFERGNTNVSADFDAIERVLINLIHNAIKFTPQNGKIILQTSIIKDKVIVSVEDNGIGIDDDEIGLIWDRFYKSDKSRSKDKYGAGLGLAIVKNIINEHGREIWVESKIGEGSKFYFTLDANLSDENSFYIDNDK